MHQDIIIHYCKKKHCGGGLGKKPDACQVLDSIILQIHWALIRLNNLIIVRHN